MPFAVLRPVRRRTPFVGTVAGSGRLRFGAFDGVPLDDPTSPRAVDPDQGIGLGDPADVLGVDPDQGVSVTS